MHILGSSSGYTISHSYLFIFLEGMPFLALTFHLKNIWLPLTYRKLYVNKYEHPVWGAYAHRLLIPEERLWRNPSNGGHDFHYGEHDFPNAAAFFY